VALVAAAAAATPTAGAAPAPPPAGDPAGIALAQAVNRYYSTPARMGVETVHLFANVTIRTRYVLAKGRVRATLTLHNWLDEPDMTEIEDERGYFSREAPKRCWIRYGPGRPGAPSSDSPLINMRGSTFHPPERFGARTRLTVLERLRGDKRHLWVSYTIETATNRIVRQEYEDLEVRYRTLPRPPRIPAPTPRCR
jgi:hypothetical protein